MRVYRGSDLSDLIDRYKQDAFKNTKLSHVYERDFVDEIKEHYFKQDNDKVLVVSGLKSTGKTTGLLQAVKDFDDVLYIIADKPNEITKSDTGAGFICELKDAPEKYIILDEFSWIEDRKDLEYYLYTLVEHGKRVAVTGTDSLALDYLNNGTLIHRVFYVNVNLFTFQEYCRIYQKPYSKESSDDFIKKGSIFTEHAKNSFVSMTNYIEEAVINNYAKLMNINIEKAKAIVYDIMYLAVCPSDTNEVIYPNSRKKDIKYQTMLSNLNIDPLIELTPFDFITACDVLEKTGFIVRTYDLLNDNENVFRLNLVNPALTYQMISAVFNADGNIKINMQSKTGYAYESYTVAYMTRNLSEGDNLYYINMGEGKPEIEIVIYNSHDRLIYLMDAKETDKRSLPDNKSLISDLFENELLKSTVLTIAGRYVISNSDSEKACLQNGKKVIFTHLESETLLRYNEFENNYESIKGTKKYRTPKVNKQKDLKTND